MPLIRDIQLMLTDKGHIHACWINGRYAQLLKKSNRVVFRFRNNGKYYVIKFDGKCEFPWQRFLKRQNDKELKNYRRIKDVDKKYFAEILETGEVQGHKYLIQEYVAHNRKITPEIQELFYQIKNKYDICDVRLDLGEKPHNFAVGPKGLKFYDLGFEDWI